MWLRNSNQRTYVLRQMPKRGLLAILKTSESARRGLYCFEKSWENTLDRRRRRLRKHDREGKMAPRWNRGSCHRASMSQSFHGAGGVRCTYIGHAAYYVSTEVSRNSHRFMSEVYRSSLRYIAGPTTRYLDRWWPMYLTHKAMWVARYLGWNIIGSMTDVHWIPNALQRYDQETGL